MRKLLSGLVAAAISFGALSLPASAQDVDMDDMNFPPSFDALKKEKCQAEKPKSGRYSAYRGNRVAGPTGPTLMDVTLKVMRCKSTMPWRSWWLHGLRDPAGKTIVPENYRNVHAVSPTAAIAQRLDKTWVLYEGGKEQALPFVPERVRAIDTRGPCTDSFARTDGVQGVLLTGPAEGGVRAFAYYHGSGQPAVFRDVPAARSVRRLGDRLYVWQRVDGAVVTRVHTLAGVPVSGTIGLVAFWQPATTHRANYADAKPDTCQMGRPTAVAMGPSLDADPAKQEIGVLWFPLADSGEFAALPDGAIGVFSLGSPFNNTTYVQIDQLNFDWISDQWALVYPEADGWSFSYHTGPLNEVIATAKGGRRYRNPVRDAATGFYAAIDTKTGKWMVPSTDYYDPVGAPADNPANAVANSIAERNRVQTARIEASQRERAERLAKARADYLSFRQERITEGRLCNYVAPLNLTIEEISFHA
jgi:hypothetical protein